MRAFLDAASAAMIRRRAILRAFVNFCLACLAGARLTTASIPVTLSNPGGFSARASEPRCASPPFPNYLGADRKMMVATGTWGVNPRSPDFFRFRRELRLDSERAPAPGRRSGSIDRAECDNRTALSDRHAT